VVDRHGQPGVYDRPTACRGEALPDADLARIGSVHEIVANVEVMSPSAVSPQSAPSRRRVLELVTAKRCGARRHGMSR
jgi:hypothetical protein